MDHFFQGDSSARRTFDIHELEVMPDNEAIEVLEKGFIAAGIKWDPQVLSSNSRNSSEVHSYLIIQ